MLLGCGCLLRRSPMHMVLYCERQIDSATTSNTHGGTHIRPVLAMKEKRETMAEHVANIASLMPECAGSVILQYLVLLCILWHHNYYIYMIHRMISLSSCMHKKGAISHEAGSSNSHCCMVTLSLGGCAIYLQHLSGAIIPCTATMLCLGFVYIRIQTYSSLHAL